MSDNISLTFDQTNIEMTTAAFGEFADILEKNAGLVDGLNDELRSLSRLARNAARGVEKLTDAANKGFSALGRLNAQLKAVNNNAGGVVALGAAGRGSGGGSAGRPASSHYQNLMRDYRKALQSQFDAIASGDVMGAKIAHQDVLRSMNAMNRASRPTPPPKIKQPKADPSLKDLIINLIGTSRIGGSVGGVSVMPLMNKITPVIEAAVGAEAGALTGPFMAAAAAIGLFVMSTKAAIQRFNTIGAMAVGSTVGQASAAYRVANALGMDPASIGQRDLGIHEPGTPGFYWASRAGINPYRNPYAGVGMDDPTNYLREIKFLLEGKGISEGQRKAAAQAFGLQDVMYAINASQAMKDMLLNHEAYTNAPSKDDLTNAADAQIAYNIALQNMQDVLVALGAEVLPSVVIGLELFVISLKEMKLAFDASPIGVILSALTGHNPLGNVADDMKDINDTATRFANMNAASDKNAASDAKNRQALDRNTDAVNRNTDQMLNWPGTFGGGRRVRSDYNTPTGWAYLGWLHGMDTVWNRKIMFGQL